VTDPEEKIGPTGEYPDGKLGEDDEGEIRFGVALDRANGIVQVDFGKPVAWLGLPSAAARDLGLSLIRKAAQLDGVVVSIAIHDKGSGRDGG